MSSQCLMKCWLVTFQTLNNFVHLLPWQRPQTSLQKISSRPSIDFDWLFIQFLYLLQCRLTRIYLVRPEYRLRRHPCSQEGRRGPSFESSDQRRHCFQLIFDLRYIAIDRLKLPVKLSDGIVERVASFDNCAGECDESRETGGKSNYRFQTAGHDRRAKSTLRGIRAKKLLLGPVSHSGCIASSKLYSLVSKESFGSPTLICEHHTTGLGHTNWLGFKSFRVQFSPTGKFHRIEACNNEWEMFAKQYLRGQQTSYTVYIISYLDYAISTSPDDTWATVPNYCFPTSPPRYPNNSSNNSTVSPGLATHAVVQAFLYN